MINQKIINALKELNIPVLLSNRGKTKTPCIVFNYIEYPLSYSDNEEDRTEYSVLLNVYANSSEVVTLSNKVKNLMKKNYFRKNEIPTLIYDEKLDIYNQPMKFKFYEDVN